MRKAEPHDFTLRQLQIFWTVVHSGSLTRAAKQMEMRQPSISQQLGNMERIAGGKLIRFVNNEMRLTPAGQFLVEAAGPILASVDRAKAGLSEFFEGRRGRLVVGALPSLARNLLVPAFARLIEEHSGYVLDIVEMAPREAIEQLHGRTIDLALISNYAAAARMAPGLRAVPVAEDAQLLAVPESLADLSAVTEPERQLDAGDRSVLNSTVRYAFGSEHSNRVNFWYETLLPGSVMVARCRSFESALAFVEKGLGSALVPELAVHHEGRPLFDVRLYGLPIPPRRTLALVHEHHMTLPGVQSFLAALKTAAAALQPLPALPPPLFAMSRLSPERGAASPSVDHRRDL